MIKKAKSKQAIIKTKNTNDVWFKRKSYGWGWTPVTWQGWLVILVWIVFYGISASGLGHEWVKNAIIMFLSIVALLYICYKKGEKPRWQWGKRHGG